MDFVSFDHMQLLHRSFVFLVVFFGGISSVRAASIDQHALCRCPVQMMIRKSFKCAVHVIFAANKIVRFSRIRLRTQANRREMHRPVKILFCSD